MMKAMWNEAGTGILVERQNGSFAFLEIGDEFEALKSSAAPYTPPPPHVPTREEQERNRQAAFQREADPLFFKWQAGEGTEAEWLEKREEIRARYPYPE